MNPLVDLLATNRQEIISHLVFPIILTIFTSIFTSTISAIQLHYLDLKEKNRYLNLLKINYPSVEAVVDTIKQFKRISHIYFVHILLFGLFLGELFSLLFIFTFSKLDIISKLFRKYISLTNISDIGLYCYALFLLVIMPVLIYLTVYLLCCFIKSKCPLTKIDNDFCKLRNSQILSYFSYWLSVGLILGPYVFGTLFVYIMITNPSFSHDFHWKPNDKFALVFTIILFLLVIFLSLIILGDIFKNIKQFPKNVIDPIINHYQCNFPNLTIKTDSEEFQGKLKDFQNKFLVTLCEGGILHFISWDKIETMKASDTNKNECTAYGEPKKKKYISVKFVASTLILSVLLVGLYTIYHANSPYNEVNDLMELGRDEDALKVINKSIDIDPNNDYAWNIKGNVLYHLGRYDEALQAYDKAIAINPNYVDAWNSKGNALYRLGKYDEALQASNKAIAINPNYADAWNGKGNALYGLGRYDEALQAYDKAIAINPNYAYAWNGKGNALYRLGRYDEALQAYDKAIAINPNYADAWNGKGNALYGLSRYDEALQASNKATELKK
ncbi:TPR domain protein, putative component of TonB system [Methanosarcina barkeri str. Wiesmoor]|nr:tetratricopeptide repeat protein [Methanosarcina barkeri]AKB51048.1 TPR domain protein, putative component of TonB system [Methanosarcina barkeri str. Wiesmoor]